MQPRTYLRVDSNRPSRTTRSFTRNPRNSTKTTTRNSNQGILTSPEAQATFANSSSTLIQHHSTTSAVFLQTEAVENGPKRMAAFNLLKKVASVE